MARPKVKVGEYRRSKPSTPAFEGNGNKPGPKTVIVQGHDRDLPKKK